MRLISSFLLMISVLVRLLLIACREAVSAFCPAASKNATTSLGGHPCAETELPCPLHLAWMIGSLAFVTHLIFSKSIAKKRLISNYGCFYAQLLDSSKHSITGQPILFLYCSQNSDIICCGIRKTMIEIGYYSSLFKHHSASC